MRQVTKLALISAVALSFGILLRVNAQQATAQADRDSTSLPTRRCWVKMELAPDTRSGAFGISVGPTVRWINLDQADSIFFYKKDKDNVAQVEAGPNRYLTADPKQMQAINRYLDQAQLK